MSRRCVSQAIGYYPVLSDQGVQYFEDGRASVRLKLPDTVKKALIQLMDGPAFDLKRGEDGFFTGTFCPPAGFSYADVVADGTVVLSPSDQLYRHAGCGRCVLSAVRGRAGQRCAALLSLVGNGRDGKLPCLSAAVL